MEQRTSKLGKVQALTFSHPRVCNRMRTTSPVSTKVDPWALMIFTTILVYLLACILRAIRILAGLVPLPLTFNGSSTLQLVSVVIISSACLLRYHIANASLAVHLSPS